MSRLRIEAREKDPRAGKRFVALVTTLALSTSTMLPRSVLAEPPKEAASRPAADDPARDRARQAFLRGTELVRDARWAEALAAFEEAEATIPHAITIYNIGACERALGRYTSARRTLERALAEHESKRTELPAALVDDTKAFLAEIDRLLARVTVTVTPEASLVVDGRPLLVSDRVGGRSDALPGPRLSELGAHAVTLPVLVAGILPPAEGSPPPAKTFVIEMDPGRHVLSFARKGFSDAVVRRDFASGTNPPLELSLDALPATVSVAANEKDAIVRIDGRDLGPVPTAIRRPAGSYKVRVEKRGFVPYESVVTLKAGEETDLRAKLVKREQPLTEKWWFWTLTSAAVTGAAVGTYFLARGTPEPKRTTVGGGSLGWRVDIP